jgi:hypothetical protein
MLQRSFRDVESWETADSLLKRRNEFRGDKIEDFPAEQLLLRRGTKKRDSCRIDENDGAVAVNQNCIRESLNEVPELCVFADRCDAGGSA